MWWVLVQVWLVKALMLSIFKRLSIVWWCFISCFLCIKFRGREEEKWNYGFYNLFLRFTLILGDVHGILGASKSWKLHNCLHIILFYEHLLENRFFDFLCILLPFSFFFAFMITSLIYGFFCEVLCFNFKFN